MKKMIAWLLSLCLMLGMIAPALAAAPEPTANQGSRSPASVSEQTETEKGFLSKRFLSENTHQFQKDERVRAIVIMESAPLTDTRYSIASADAGVYTARLQREKNTVYSAMRANKVDYELVYTFDTLLNGFSCDVAYGDLETIARLPGVQSVHIANVYSIPTPQEPNMAVSNETTKINSVHTGGYKGQGMVVAVLDSGTYLEHEAFQDYGNLDSAALTQAKVTAAIQKDKVENGQYISAKIPFAYDYADRDNDPTDDGAGTGGHGTHVAGIAVGYAEDDDGAVTFSGAAPMAQLLAMKIFASKQSTTSSDVYFKALEDAMKLGADVINMSIGSDSGFTYDSELEDKVFGNIYEKLEQAGIVVCISNGNSYSMDEYATRGYISADYTDYGTAGSPASYTGNVAVGSMENAAYPQFVVKVGGRNSEDTFPYSDASDDGLWVKNFGGKNVEYVLLEDTAGKYTQANGGNGLCIGAPEDYDAILNPKPVTPPEDESAAPTAEDSGTPAEEPKVNPFEGKIVVVSRGSSTFSEKVKAAYDAGAAGVVVVNNQSGVINMSVENYYIPAISVELSHIGTLRSAGTKTFYTNRNSSIIESSVKGEMSDFSSWGTTPSLTLRPVLTSVGGNIYSADWHDAYGYTLMSGTSMSSPNLAGTFASLLSYLYDQDAAEDMTKAEIAEAAKLLMESSAQLIEDPDELLYSVRKQGAGLARADQAILAWESGYVTNPIHELGDDADETGSYSFTVKVKNNSAEAITYNTSIVVMTDTSEALRNQQGAVVDYRNTLQSTYLYDSREGADDQGLATVTMSDTVTVPAGAEASVPVTVTLTSEGKDYFEDNGFTNGSFVEGYVLFTAAAAAAADEGDEGGDTPAGPAPIHATFLGYFGDWTQAPVLESADFQDYLDADYFVHTYDADGKGHTYADYGYDAYAFLDVYTDVNWAYLLDTDYNYMNYLGGNMFSGYNSKMLSTDVSYAPYNPAHNMLSTNWQDAGYPLLYVNPYQLRNASFMEMVITDSDTGAEYYRSNPDTDVFDSSYVQKAVYSASGGYWASYTHLIWDGTDKSGRPLPDGTTVHVTLNATLPYGEDSVQEDCWQIPDHYDETTGELVYRSGFEVTMDSTAPEVVSTHFTPAEDPWDFVTPAVLDVTVKDQAPASVVLLLNNTIVGYALFPDAAADKNAIENDDGTVTQTVSIELPGFWSELYNKIEIAVLDYATNETDTAALLVDNIGDPATVKLVSPQGTETIETEVGSFFTFPDCTDAVDPGTGKEAQFLFWCDQFVEDVSTNEEFYETYGADSIHFAQSETLIAGDAAFYAVYQVGESAALEQPMYTAYGRTDYTGDWAIVGQPYYNDGYRYDDPYVLDENGATQQLKTLDEDVDLSTADYNEFASSAEGIRFTFTPVEGTPFYTIQNAKTGKYLTANASGKIIMADSADDEAAQWMVAAVDSPRPISLIMSRVMTDDDYPQFLLFNDDANPYEFQLMNTSQEITIGTSVYTPTEVYCTYLYNCSDTGMRNTVYTSDVKPYIDPISPDAPVVPDLSDNPGQPSDPSAPDTETRDNEDGTTTTIVTDKETGTVTETTEKEDGTVEVVETKKDGTVTETTEKPDGSTEVVETKPDGTVTETATDPEGGKVEKITTPDEDVTITVTDAEGEVLAKVELPAEIPAVETRFEDVPEGHWADEAIHSMAALEVVNGVGDDRFDMDSGMTRGALATVLSRLSHGQEGLEASFADVDADKWYADGIAWAAKTGVVTGYSATEFGPEDVITREQLAVMLCRYARLLGMDTTADSAALDSFTDGSTTHGWAADSIAWCVENGILNGMGNGTLAPTATATRAQVAVMLQRFIDLMK